MWSAAASALVVGRAREWSRMRVDLRVEPPAVADVPEDACGGEEEGGGGGEGRLPRALEEKAENGKRAGTEKDDENTVQKSNRSKGIK